MLNFQRFFSSRARHSWLSDLHKAARGSILGAFIGDSAGAVLEFSGKMANERDVERAVRFEGGGPRHLAPGQITGDSEMALAMMRGILACTMEENNPKFNQYLT